MTHCSGSGQPVTERAPDREVATVPRILIASRIDADATKDLQRWHDVVCAFDSRRRDLQALIADREVLVFRSGVEISSALLASAPRMKLLIRAGSGPSKRNQSWRENVRLKALKVSSGDELLKVYDQCRPYADVITGLERG